MNAKQIGRLALHIEQALLEYPEEAQWQDWEVRLKQIIAGDPELPPHEGMSGSLLDTLVMHLVDNMEQSSRPDASVEHRDGRKGPRREEMDRFPSVTR